MIDFTLYTANTAGNQANCVYPNEAQITDKASFEEAIKYDHVCAKFKGNYRSNDNFEHTNVLPMDCDNDHSDNPRDWVYPLDVAMAFSGVAFIVSYSRNNMKAKGGKSARPRFHVYFQIPEMTDGREYANLKIKVQQYFPYFDEGALGEARFLYATEDPNVEVFDGEMSIADFFYKDGFAEFDARTDEIAEGSRNNTMSRIAGKLVKRYGYTDTAQAMFMKEAEKCNPPLDDLELDKIWYSAGKFAAKVAGQEGYIPPEVYNAGSILKPTDFSDVGQAVVMASEYGGKLRYSPATDYLVYNGSFWEESAPKAQGISQELTERQLEEADAEMKRAMDEMVRNGAFEIIGAMGVKKAEGSLNSMQRQALDMFKAAQEYKKYAIKRRDSKYIASTLKEGRPMLEVAQNSLDANEFMLNCPSGTVDLRKGAASIKDHDPEDFITKQTSVDPGETGMKLWHDALSTFFQGDKQLVDYVQKIVGLSAIGKVYVEALIIAYGEGRNGKSTFWNVVSRVLGTYSGNISADMLTVGCRRNVKPELAEAKGKRLLIAAELEEGMRLNTSNVKQLCSTDEIYAEKKYKDPFSYTPTHTLVLYTNHLPKVGAIDKGTWRRLIVIPFGAKIEGSADIKNYADYLFENAGGAILTWIIEGAKKVIADDFRVETPSKVKAAIKDYRDNNDWMTAFLQDRCELDTKAVAKSGEVYNEYRAYCNQVGEYVRSLADFYSAIEFFGFERFRDKKGRYIKGLRLKSEFEEE